MFYVIIMSIIINLYRYHYHHYLNILESLTLIVFRFHFMTFYGKRMNIYMKICTYIYLQNSIIYLSRMRASTLFSAQVLFKNVVRKREKKTLEGIKLKSNSQFSQSKQWMNTLQIFYLDNIVS